MTNKNNIIELLHNGGYSCVICNNEQIYTYNERGIKDLYNILTQNSSILKGAFIADKVVGRAAASLMILGGISELYTDVISTHALTFFQSTEIKVEYKTLVPHIINRTGTDWCPMEKRCVNFTTPQESLEQIKDFLSSLKV